MKRVTFEEAEILKNAGYPQYENEERKLRGLPEMTDIPTYIEVWLWLWKEKCMYIDINHDIDLDYEFAYLHYDGEDFHSENNDPEEAITKAIKHLFEHNLIKND